MRCSAVFPVTLAVLASVASAQIHVEPPDFSNEYPGGNATLVGTGCVLVASGTITSGDVDWIRVTLPVAMDRVVVDLDFADGTGKSALFAEVAGGSSAFNNGDGNNALDDLCGLGSATDPLGSTFDAVVNLGATPTGRIIAIGITGGADGGFNGSHEENFAYEVWLHLTPAPCESDADCTDDLGCTLDTCDVSTGICLHAPDDSACDDAVFCNGEEVCDAEAGCVAGPPPSCDDAIACTIDSCDATSDACEHTANDGLCDDGVFCDGAERCDGSSGCVDGLVPECDDGIVCTVDACDIAADACIHEPDDTFCSDGLLCNGEETCDPLSGCKDGTPRCAPGQSCDPETGECGSSPGVELTLDITPGACPNRIPQAANGYVGVALVSVGGFDVGLVDVSSLSLSRADGVGGSIVPNSGPPGPGTGIEDVATPVEPKGEDCACTDEGGDGYDDLFVRFSMARMLTTLKLAGSRANEPTELTLRGTLTDGTPFAVSDCVVLAGQPQRGPRSAVDDWPTQLQDVPAAPCGAASVLTLVLMVAGLGLLRLESLARPRNRS